ncbi:hypothetical protein C0J45_2053 [Silurus meridionalis]|nr:hypothetical protein C0J45_2053 [Silurus meridionalis]
MEKAGYRFCSEPLPARKKQTRSPDSEHFVVTGADHAVFAHEGEDVILNCSVDSHVPASEIEEVTWKKTDGDEGILVLLYQNSEIFPDSSHESYRGRVDFFSSEISNGNFSLQLKEIKMEDKGEFTCEVHTSDMSANTTVILHGVEHFVVKGADHAVFAHEGEDVILNCSVDSHVPVSEIEEVTWKKTDGDQDILVLLYQDSEIFPDSSHESYKGRVDLFLSEITKGNFSLKLKEVKMEDKGEFTCEVHTSNMSARTTVVLHVVGFSALPVLILVFCLIALLLAVGFCGPVFNLLRKKGFLLEVITCLTVSIIRPIMLIKTSLYINRFPRGVHITLSSLMMFAFTCYEIFFYILFSLLFKTFVMDLCSTATAAFLITANGTMCLYYTYINVRSQDFFHIMVYMFGAVGLSTINSIVLATELILKAGLRYKDGSQEWHPVWSSAAVAHPPQGCCRNGGSYKS